MQLELNKTQSGYASVASKKAKKHPNPLNCNLCCNWSPLTIQLEAWGKEWINQN